MNYAVSIIFPAHNEGRLCHSTLQSVLRALQHAGEKRITAEIIILLDCATHETVDYFSGYSDNLKIRHVSFDDPGLSYNHGVEEAEGEYIFFIGAGDLFSGNWVEKAYSYLAQNHDKLIMAHTEYTFGFGREPFYWKKQSSSADGFKIDKMVENSCWDISCAGDREIFLRLPFSATVPDSGFAFREWHLYCDTLAAGIEQHIVPGTVYFTRSGMSGFRPDLCGKDYNLLPPSPFFSETIFPRLFL